VDDTAARRRRGTASKKNWGGGTRRVKRRWQRRARVGDNLVIPPALAARAAVLAFGDELVDHRLPDDPDSQWLSKAGRELAAASLLPRAEAALRQELQRLADAARRAHQGQSSSSSGSRAL
jgi:hypothetical protein